MSDENKPSDWWIITPEELKTQFEASPIIQPVIRKSLIGTAGEWIDGFWYYFDSELMKRFTAFCEGFMQGAIAIVSIEDKRREKREQTGNMKRQLEEKDEEGIYDFIDIKQYKDI